MSDDAGPDQATLSGDTVTAWPAGEQPERFRVDGNLYCAHSDHTDAARRHAQVVVRLGDGSVVGCCRRHARDGWLASAGMDPGPDGDA